MKRLFFGFCVALVLGVIGLLFFYSERTFQVAKTSLFFNELSFGDDENIQARGNGLFTGKPCRNASRRPLAIMLAGDEEARPLSGISAADMVIEIPVSIDSITRYLAFYQCQSPSEIGSVRSARSFFIGLAKGYGAIFAHWGGEKDALHNLRSGVIDNLDALPNPLNAFWRKEGIPTPHDGFTSYENLFAASEKLHYDLNLQTSNFFTFKENSQATANSHSIIIINYPGKFQVSYHYDPDQNIYLRFKGGTKEMDVLTGGQIGVKNVVILKTTIYPSYSQYNEVELEGKEGELEAFIGGRVYKGRWTKKGFSQPLLFFDSNGNPMEFEPGTIWVQVVGETQHIEVIPLRDIRSERQP